MAAPSDGMTASSDGAAIRRGDKIFLRITFLPHAKYSTQYLSFDTERHGLKIGVFYVFYDRLEKHKSLFFKIKLRQLSD